MSKKMNAGQINILVSMISDWAKVRREKSEESEGAARRARSEAIQKACATGLVKLNKDAKSSATGVYGSMRDRIQITIEGTVDRKLTSKPILALIDAEADRHGRCGDWNGNTVELPWTSNGSHIRCDKADRPTVLKAVELIASMILGGDALDVADKIRELLK